MTPGFWERIKAEERAERRRCASRGDGVLDGVPVGLPALTRAIKLQSKAARSGFDWPSLAPVFDKLKEELAELEEAVAGDGRASAVPSATAKIEEEFGDLLFVVANVARHLKVDPEAALRAANQKFTRRFHAIEQLLGEGGKHPRSIDARRDGSPLGSRQGRRAQRLSALPAPCRAKSTCHLASE